MSVSICEGRTFESAIAEAAVRMSPGGIISGWRNQQFASKT